jgi:hypothetical protein
MLTKILDRFKFKKTTNELYEQAKKEKIPDIDRTEQQVSSLEKISDRALKEEQTKFDDQFAKIEAMDQKMEHVSQTLGGTSRGAKPQNQDEIDLAILNAKMPQVPTTNPQIELQHQDNLRDLAALKQGPAASATVSPALQHDENLRRLAALKQGPAASATVSPALQHDENLRRLAALKKDIPLVVPPVRQQQRPAVQNIFAPVIRPIKAPLTPTTMFTPIKGYVSDKPTSAPIQDLRAAIAKENALIKEYATKARTLLHENDRLKQSPSPANDRKISENRKKASNNRKVKLKQTLDLLEAPTPPPTFSAPKF